MKIRPSYNQMRPKPYVAPKPFPTQKFPPYGSQFKQKPIIQPGYAQKAPPVSVEPIKPIKPFAKTPEPSEIDLNAKPYNPKSSKLSAELLDQVQSFATSFLDFGTDIGDDPANSDVEKYVRLVDMLPQGYTQEQHDALMIANNFMGAPRAQKTPTPIAADDDADDYPSFLD